MSYHNKRVRWLLSAHDYLSKAEREFKTAETNLNRYNTEFDLVFTTETKNVASACQTVARLKAQMDLEKAQIRLDKAREFFENRRKAWLKKSIRKLESKWESS